MFDVIIIGSGPAGASTAIRLRAAGHKVALIDRALFPRDKACGEGILPSGVATLRELGLAEHLFALEPARVHWIDFVVGGHRARGALPGVAVGIDRLRFDAMLAHAASDAGAMAIHGEPASLRRERAGRVTGVVLRDGRIFEAPVLIGADGLRSWTRGAAGIDVDRSGRRFGLCARFETSASPGSHVEVLVVPGYGELYVGPSGPRQLSITWLTTREAMREMHTTPDDRFREALARRPDVQRRLASTRPMPSVRGAGPFPAKARMAGRDGVLLVGDALESIDPIGGDGISLALAASGPCADAAIRLLHGEPPAAVVREYGNTMERATSRRRGFASLLTRAATHDRVARHTVRALEASEAITSALCAWHEGGLGAAATMAVVAASA